MSASILIDGNGRFEGYASLFGKIDQGGDVVMPGAFANSLKKRPASQIRMLFQHDPKEPIGRWLEVRETDIGLKVRGELTATVPRSDALAALIEHGSLDGLSIGFRTIKAARSQAAKPRRLLDVDLWEISIVTFPMLASARIQPPKLARQLRRASQLFASNI